MRVNGMMAFIYDPLLSSLLALHLGTIKAFMQSMIRSINRYRQMDPHGLPADSSLYIALVAAVALYAYAAYRLSRK